MPRSSMTALITRLHVLLNNDVSFEQEDCQFLLDDHAFVVDTILQPKAPLYRQHTADAENLEADAVIFTGYDTLLVVGVDYTIDLQRGIVTTPQAFHQTLRLQGMAYDLFSAAADGWEQIASRYVAEFDIASTDGSLKLSQQHEQALTQAKRYRARAWTRSATAERADTPGQGMVQQVVDGWDRSFR